LVPLTEAFLQDLLQKYSHGHVFTAVEQQSPNQQRHRHGGKETAHQIEATALLEMLPSARSIAFIPLWDSHRERWFGGAFIWTARSTTRALTRTEDLNYLAAFGNSIMAEAARLDVVGADRVKSDFISSISHELRSPLHGILASVELLQETTVDLFQYGMIDTIERCGRTLLDTIQHVLDFAKINTSTTSAKSRSGKGPRQYPSRPPLASGTPTSANIDLGLLTEDVVDSVFAGYEFQGRSSLVAVKAEADLPPGGFSQRNSVVGMEREGYNSSQNKQEPNKDRIDVIMDIEYRPNWTFNTQPGALTRILMNLFGNALKYTGSGWVKVSLQAKEIAAAASSQPGQCVVTISVSDTGRGMSQEYLQGGLFTPFTQEDPMNPGTGLGLSIVLQIVRSLSGTINITSEPGVGTEVVVSLVLKQASSSGHHAIHRYREGEDIVHTAQRKSSGLTVGLVGLGDSTTVPEQRPSVWQVETSEPSLSLQASVERMVTDWFGMKVATPETQESSPPDIYLANE
jgi:signal transduction histidine kinase